MAATSPVGLKPPPVRQFRKVVLELDAGYRSRSRKCFACSVNGVPTFLIKVRVDDGYRFDVWLCRRCCTGEHQAELSRAELWSDMVEQRERTRVRAAGYRPMQQDRPPHRTSIAVPASGCPHCGGNYDRFGGCLCD